MNFDSAESLYSWRIFNSGASKFSWEPYRLNDTKMHYIDKVLSSVNNSARNKSQRAFSYHFRFFEYETIHNWAVEFVFTLLFVTSQRSNQFIRCTHLEVLGNTYTSRCFEPLITLVARFCPNLIQWPGCAWSGVNIQSSNVRAIHMVKES